MIWAWCARCNAAFEKGEASQRFCSRTCGRFYRYHGPEDMSDPMQPMADRCAKFVINVGDKRGVTPRDLARYIGDDYRALLDSERFRVHVLLCKAPGIAFAAKGDEFRFWPRSAAPADALRASA